MPQPLVSILIPVKNTASFLSECLTSIVGQTYSNWELIIVDDSSEDNSCKIAEQFAFKDPRIKLLKNNGVGIIHALQTAYLAMNGELVTRMDSDDIMKQDRLQWMVNELMKHGMGHLAIGQVSYFSELGISNGYDRYEKWLNKLTREGINYSEIYKECVVPSPCWMAFKADFDKCGAFESDVYPEDYDLTFRFYEYGLHCIPCDQILHLWRDYETRTSRTSEHYAQNNFLSLKLDYFLKLDHSSNRPLVIWGAGNKGKTIAKYLIEKNFDFHWICDNPKKIGKDIYGKKLDHFEILNKIPNTQSIITVANEESQLQIKAYFTNLNLESMKDYFFFC